MASGPRDALVATVHPPTGHHGPDHTFGGRGDDRRTAVRRPRGRRKRRAPDPQRGRPHPERLPRPDRGVRQASPPACDGASFRRRRDRQQAARCDWDRGPPTPRGSPPGDADDLRRPAGRRGGGPPGDAVRRDLLHREDATVHGAPARDRGGAYPRGREPASPRRDGTDASAGPHGTEYRRGATVPEPDAPPDDPSTGPRPGLEHG